MEIPYDVDASAFAYLRLMRLKWAGARWDGDVSRVTRCDRHTPSPKLSTKQWRSSAWAEIATGARWRSSLHARAIYHAGSCAKGGQNIGAIGIMADE